MRSTRIALAAALLASPLVAQEVKPRLVSVSGAGQVEVVPDVATVSYDITDRGADVSVSAETLIEQNKTRVAPTVEYLQSVIGSNGTVTALPQISKVLEWDQEGRKQVFKGYQVVTRIQVELCGEQNIADNLGKLFDSSKIKADEMSQPVMSLSRPTAKAAQLQATQLAVQDAVSSASALLEPGEKLGAIVSRGNRAEPPTPVYERAAMRAAPAGGADVGQAIVQTGKMQVNAVFDFIFEVTGTASRMLTGTDVTGKSDKGGVEQQPVPQS